MENPINIEDKNSGIRLIGIRLRETQGSVPAYGEFIKESRSFLGLKGNERVEDGHMQALASRYNLFPVAFLTLGFRNHLNLVVAPREEGLLVYDPLLPTLKIIPYTLIRSQSNPTRDDKILLHYMRGNGAINMQPESLSSDGYQLPEEPLRALGKIQNDSYNCGIACIYAALVAKESKKDKTGIKRVTGIRLRPPAGGADTKSTIKTENIKFKGITRIGVIRKRNPQ